MNHGRGRRERALTRNRKLCAFGYVLMLSRNAHFMHDRKRHAPFLRPSGPVFIELEKQIGQR